MTTHHDLTAFVLAGGQSTRMGRDKALLEFEGRTLLEHAIELCSRVAPEVKIVGPRELYGRFGDVVEDIFPGRGPLGGIHAALSSSRSELNLALAVDVPFVTAELLNYLVNTARDAGTLVTVPLANGGYQPLCAVYRRNFADRAERALQAGRNKIDPLFTPEATRVVSEEDLRRHGFPAKLFVNLNTPEEWAEEVGPKSRSLDSRRDRRRHARSG